MVRDYYAHNLLIFKYFLLFSVERVLKKLNCFFAYCLSLLNWLPVKRKQNEKLHFLCSVNSLFLNISKRNLSFCKCWILCSINFLCLVAPKANRKTFIRVESHIGFCTLCVIMRVERVGGSLSLMTFWKSEKLFEISSYIQFYNFTVFLTFITDNLENLRFYQCSSKTMDDKMMFSLKLIFSFEKLYLKFHYFIFFINVNSWARNWHI